MDFYLILQSIMDEKNINIPTTARMCGLSDGTVRSIIVRKQKNVALEVAFKLSKGLGVSLERLNGMPEKSYHPELSPDSFSIVEKELIYAYRLATEDDKLIIDTLLKKYKIPENQETASVG